MLGVKRNTDYILGKQNKPKNVENVLTIVKEEPCEMPLFPPDEQTATSKNEIIAYDLEIVLWDAEIVPKPSSDRVLTSVTFHLTFFCQLKDKHIIKYILMQDSKYINLFSSVNSK